MICISMMVVVIMSFVSFGIISNSLRQHDAKEECRQVNYYCGGYDWQQLFGYFLRRNTAHLGNYGPTTLIFNNIKPKQPQHFRCIIICKVARNWGLQQLRFVNTAVSDQDFESYLSMCWLLLTGAAAGEVLVLHHPDL